MNVQHTILHFNIQISGKLRSIHWQTITDVSVERFILLDMDVRNVGAIYQSQRHSYNSLKPHTVLTSMQQWTLLL
jgi:hypothetical protein